MRRAHFCWVALLLLLLLSCLATCELPRKRGVQSSGGRRGGWLRAIEKVTRRYSIREQEGGGAEGPSPGEGCRRIRHEGDRLVSLLLFLPRQEGVLYAEAVWD